MCPTFSVTSITNEHGINEISRYDNNQHRILLARKGRRSEEGVGGGQRERRFKSTRN